MASGPSFDPVVGADVFDVHAHVMAPGCEWDLGPYGFDDHVAALAAAGIGSGAVFAGRNETGYVDANRHIVEACRGSALLPFGRIGLFGDGPAELEAAIALDVRGLKVHTRNVRPDAEKLQPLFAQLAATGLPIVFHSGVFDNVAPQVLTKAVDRHDWSHVIVAHAGKNLWPQAVELCRERDNVSVDTSVATYFQTRRVMEALGPERVMFGTDEPFGDAQIERLKVEKALAYLWPDDASARAAVMGGNARRVLGLPLLDER